MNKITIIDNQTSQVMAEFDTEAELLQFMKDIGNDNVGYFHFHHFLEQTEIEAIEAIKEAVEIRKQKKKDS